MINSSCQFQKIKRVTNNDKADDISEFPDAKQSLTHKVKIKKSAQN